ncbi:MAG: hypothetical protein KJO05_05150 [Bacteroidia bacterium]|nr:hypothetical protein [Bacteroidia bacterium]NNF30994.1 hypothetical protein [Flavobacteriaceae bacterium]MBT8274956.1 hypothetical protein [Bacteroidia bacterium]NNJ82569.1 hypothetical protein [Flavobacteriaceae bacterium]NNK54922.1 hypothetical protein [Flavobacteriaceae bacterium]
MKYFIAICLFTFFGTSYAQEEKVETPQIAIRIDLGETINLEGAQITFAEVLEDSRCPTDVQCVWAGRARVLILVSEPDKPEVSKEVIFGQVMQNEVKDMLLLLKEEYVIKAINIAPYPKEPGEELEYSILIRKSKKKDQ